MALLDCQRCKGYGKIWRIEANGGREVTCPHCEGTGKSDKPYTPKNRGGMIRVLWVKEPLHFLTLVVYTLILIVLIWQVWTMRDEINLVRDEIRVRQRPFFGLTIPQVQFRDKDADVTKHEVVFTMNFENKGPVQANGIKIDQELYYVKKDYKIEKPKEQLFNYYRSPKDISILPNHMYPKKYMENLKTLKDKLFKEYGEPTKPGYLYIHTYVKYYGIKKEPLYFQETVYLFEWAPAHTKEGVFHLYLSKSN